MLIDLPGTGDIHLSIMQSLLLLAQVIHRKPLRSLIRKEVNVLSEAINVPVLELENMAYFTPEELPNNKYYILDKKVLKNLAEDLEVPFLGEVPIVQSIREAGDYGRPAAMQTGSVVATVFEEITRKVVEETVRRNDSLPTEAIQITTMAGCSAVKIIRNRTAILKKNQMTTEELTIEVHKALEDQTF
jgi:ATP-binding protein involved in chromosome partitioning